MRRHPIPSTDLEVSALCLGGGGFGSRVGGADLERLIGRFLDAGGNWIDTAHCYAFWQPEGAGCSERELGRALRAMEAGARVVVATKGGHPEMGAAYRRPDDFLSPRTLAADLDDSLARLGREQIDLYYLHRDDPRVPVAEIVGALNAEARRGRVRWLGASNWSLERLAEANAHAAREGLRGFAVAQLQWSLAVPTWRPTPDPTMRFVTGESARQHAAARVPIVAYSATAGGYFSGRDSDAFNTPENRARRDRARELAARKGCTPTQVALAWLMHQAPLTFPLFSTADPNHLAEALGAADVTLTAEETAWLAGDANGPRPASRA
jgi:aryl-alcohol dehydrogenase-like predicted oxidoreductase